MRQIKPMKDLLVDLSDYLCNPPEAIKLPSMPRFNEITGGFRAHEFSILCGSTGAGKTSLLANWSADLVLNKTKHFVMSVETGHLDFLARVFSVVANEDLNTGDPVSRDKVLRLGVKEHQKFFSDYIEFSLYDNRVPLEELMKDLEWAVQNKCKLAFIDNLNFFMDITTDKNWVIEMDRVTHELIMFCKRNPIHIVMVMHPNKGKAANGTRVESEFDVKGSSTAVQEAQNIFLFNRPPQESVEAEQAKFTDRELKIAKMRRRGKYVGRVLVFSGETPRYVEKGFLNDIWRDEQKTGPESNSAKSSSGNGKVYHAGRNYERD